MFNRQCFEKVPFRQNTFDEKSDQKSTINQNTDKFNTNPVNLYLKSPSNNHSIQRSRLNRMRSQLSLRIPYTELLMDQNSDINKKNYIP